MTDTHVEIIPEHIDAIGLGTLAAKTALVIESQHNDITSPFMMTHVRGSIVLKAADQGDTVVVGMAQGNASLTEIKTALEATQKARSPSQQAATRKVLHQTLMTLICRTTAQPDKVFIDEKIGGKKGIPFDEAVGWQWFAYNPDDGAFASGAELLGQMTYNGVWL